MRFIYHKFTDRRADRQIRRPIVCKSHTTVDWNKLFVVPSVVDQYLVQAGRSLRVLCVQTTAEELGNG